MSKYNVNWDLMIEIPRLPCLFMMTKAVSFTVALVISDTSDSINLFNFGMCTFAGKYFFIELVPCSDG